MNKHLEGDNREESSVEYRLGEEQLNTIEAYIKESVFQDITNLLQDSSTQHQLWEDNIHDEISPSDLDDIIYEQSDSVIQCVIKTFEDEFLTSTFFDLYWYLESCSSDNYINVRRLASDLANVFGIFISEISLEIFNVASGLVCGINGKYSLKDIESINVRWDIDVTRIGELISDIKSVVKDRCNTSASFGEY